MPKTLLVDNQVLVKDKKITFLSSDAASAATSITVQSIVGFNSLTTSSGQIIVVGDLGDENCEIIKTSSATAPSGSTVTLASGLQFGHPQDTKVTIVDWDRVEFQWASTTGGTKSTIAAYPFTLQVDQLETLYRDTTQTTGYYFARFNETIGNTNSDWSDPIPFGGYPDNTVLAIKNRALNSINEKISDIITHEFLNEALWQGRREYHFAPGKRPFRKIFNVSIGTVTAGNYRFLLPDAVERPYTAENVFGVRIGTNPNISYYDKKDWDNDFNSVAKTTLTTAYAVGNKDLYVANAREFNSSSGSVVIEGDTISYNAVGLNPSSGTLRISTQGTASHAVGADVWQGASFGLPRNFTVFSDVAPAEFYSTGSVYIYMSQPLSTAYTNLDVFMDYYRKIVDNDSDFDAMDEPEYDMFVPYLAWRIKKRKNAGLVAETDEDYKEWIFKKNNSLSNEYLGANIRLFPKIDHLP